MRIDIITIFPEIFTGPLQESIIKKAIEKNIIDIKIHNLRSFTTDKHHTVDDRPFGGGPGMVIKIEPVWRALKSLGVNMTARFNKWPSYEKPIVICLSPQGETLNHKIAFRLSKYKRLILLCGHYEGFDERVFRWVNQEISIGDYVLTGGEIPSLVLIDCVTRLIPGVVKREDSITKDSFYRGLLDYPNFTRPAVFKGYSVPKILLSGNHAKIEEWRIKQMLITTLRKRPDLLKNVNLTKQEKDILDNIKEIKN